MSFVPFMKSGQVTTTNIWLEVEDSATLLDSSLHPAIPAYRCVDQAQGSTPGLATAALDCLS